MKRARSIPFLALACVLLLPLIGARAATEEPAELLHLIVLHTNDVHGQVLPLPATWLKDRDPLPDSGGIERIGAYVRKVRAEAAAKGEAVLFVDGGDWFQGTPEGRLDEGRAFLAAFRELGHDAMAVGNHEFDYGVETFLAHLEAVPLPALMANARLESGGVLPGTAAYKIVECGGLRVGVVGLLSTATPAMSHPTTRTLLWTPAEEALADAREAMGEDVDLVLPITHLGVNSDRRLAKAHPDLPLIVGGHSHTLLHKGVTEGTTLIVQSGSKGRGVGRVDLWFDSVTKKVVRTKAEVVNLYEKPEPSEAGKALAEKCAALLERSAKHMDVVVGTFGGPLSRGRDPYRTSPAGNLITDVMRERAEADVAIHNRGGIRVDLEAGEATRRDLFRILPFDNRLMMMTLTGAQIEALMRRSIEGRGRSGLEFSGMQIHVRRGSKGPLIERIDIGGEELHSEFSYRVVTNDFLASGGDAYIELASTNERQLDPILQRDLLELALKQAGGTLTPSTENRYSVKE